MKIRKLNNGGILQNSWEGGGSSKSKSKDRLREKSLGGQLIQTGVSFIPGVGQILAPLVGIADQQLDAEKQAKKEQEAQLKLQQPPLQINNPYGNFKNGGVLNDMFHQYNTGSHQSGNDLQVDTQGMPSPDGPNSVQNRENSYKVGDNQYVMSDALTNPKTGNKFNVDAMSINKKYPKARFQSDQLAALNLEMKNLSKVNDVVRQGEESKQLAYGGPVLGNALKDATNYWKNNQYVSPDQVPPADGNMFVAPKMGIPDDYTGIQPALDSTNPVPQNKGVLAGQVQMNSVLSAEDAAGRDAQAKYDAEQAAKKASGEGILDPKTKDRDTTGVLDPKSANNIALGMKGLALAGSVYDALQPAEKEKLLTPNYSKSDAYMQSANIDFTQAKQDAMGVSNISANMNRSLSGNAAQYQGREQSRLAQLQDSLGRISEGENNAQSQLNLTKGTYEQQKAVDYSNREYANQQGNMQNQAAARGFGRQLASDLSQIGSSFNQYAETTKLNQNTQDMAKFANSQIMATINAKNPNFKLQDNVVENFLSGKTSLDDTLAFVLPENQEAAKKILLETQAKIKAKDGK